MLSTGATLYIVPEKFYIFPAKLMKYISDNSINMIFWVPSVLINVANNKLLEKIDCKCLKKILFAGEVMHNKHLNYWRKYIPNALYSNLYGPTEITVDCTYYIVDRDFKDEDPLPIGKACRNTDILILDDNNCMIQEPNRIGELCVRGSSLALGYWNNIDKTNEVFVQNPLNTNYREIIYRTGDMVYYNEQKEIMFNGRKDFQIKHMGYRIELGEIETATGSISQIENVCVCYDSIEKKIIMFYILKKEITQKEIRESLLKRIPKYMIPNVYCKVNNFIYTDNGKINRLEMMNKYKENSEK